MADTLKEKPQMPPSIRKAYGEITKHPKYRELVSSDVRFALDVSVYGKKELYKLPEKMRNSMIRRIWKRLYLPT